MPVFLSDDNISWSERMVSMLSPVLLLLVGSVLVAILMAFVVRATWAYLLPGLLMLVLIGWLLFGA